MKRILLVKILVLLLIGYGGTVYAQGRVVSGKVTSADDGSPLPGVNVLVKGTTNGTVTDGSGNFSIPINENDRFLIFSFIGFESKEVEIGSQTLISVALNTDATELNEVIVTAVGIERDKKAIGYGTQTVRQDQFLQKSEPDVLRSMQGKVPGLNITGSGGIAGGSTRITIRGINSFQGNNQPLFVVDGIPYDNSLNNTTNPAGAAGALSSSRIADLDPNNIASITTLNGGAAAAIYGTRAANGVIVITTKSGSSKKSKKGLEASFATSYAIEQVANLPDYQNKYGTGTRNTFAHANGSWGPAFNRLDSIPMFPGYSAVFPTLYKKQVTGVGLVDVNIPYQAVPNNVEDFFINGSVVENSLSLTGGNDKASITAVISDMNQKGFIRNTGFRRTNFSVGGNTQLDNGIFVSANLQYTRTVQNAPLTGAGGQSPFSRLLFQPRLWPLNDLPYTDPLTGRSVYFFPFADGVDNPYWSLDNSFFDSVIDRIVTSFSVGKDITDWLNVTYKVGYNTFTDNRKQVINRGSAAGAQQVGSITLDNIKFGELESNALVTLTPKLSNDFDLRAILGHNFNQRVNERQSVIGLNFLAPNIFDIDNTATPQVNGGDFSKRKLWAVFSDVTLGYKDFAFLNVTLRNDNSSTLPANNRSFWYYGVNGSLMLTDVLAIKSNILTSAKIRGGYSRVGRDANPYQLFNSINLLNNDGFGAGTVGVFFPFNGQPAATIPNTSFNPNLKPEFTDEVEVGTNLEFFNGRISIDATYYNRLTTNQISARSLPTASGFESAFSNFGAIRNKGWEVGLNLIPVKLTNGFEWGTNVAFTRNRNLVEKLQEGVEELIIGNNGVLVVVRPGQPFGVFRGTVAARDDQGRLLINRNTGLMIPKAQQEIVGDPNPDFLLGVSNTFRFKGFTLSALMEWRQGGDLWSQTTALLLGRGVTRDTENRDIPKIVPGVLGDAEKPLLDASGNAIVNTIMVAENDLWFQGANGSFAINAPTEFNVFDATTLRLREITLGYDLPKDLLSKTPFGSVNISVSGRNLWFWSPYMPKYTNYDPEVSSFGAGNAQGVDINAAPTTKRYGVNLRVTF
jgi:TonB-linked SusC/RagA family outer membrane protein